RPLYFEAHARPTLASRIVARFARKVVVISNGLKRAYESAGVPAGKIIVAPDAVDERLFDSVADRASVRAVLGLPQDKKIVGYAGHLYPRKGAATLAEAARKLPDVLFVFAGGTPEDVGTFKEKWGSLPNVLIIGHVPHSKVPLYL